MSIASKIAHSAAWSFIGKILAQLINFGVFVVLARLLLPEDFGLFGMVLVVLGFVAMISEVGFVSALIQREEVSDDDWSTVFWFNQLLGVAFALLMVAISPLVAWFYEEPRSMAMVAALGLQFPLSALSGVHIAMLRRRMEFAYLAKLDVLGEIVAGGLAIGLAMMDFGAWSLVFKGMAIYIVLMVATWTRGFWRPKLRFDRQTLRDNLKYSIGFFNWNFSYFWSRNADNMIVGKLMGAQALGFYTRAYTTMLMPMRQVSAVASKVMFPGLSRLQHDPEQVKAIYLRAVGFIALLAFPSMLGLAVVAPDFVLTLYGPKWAGSIEVLTLLCLVGMIESVTTTTNWLFLSQGRSDLLARWSLFSTALLIGGFFIGAYMGLIELVALIYLFLAAVVFPYPAFTWSGKLVGMRAVEVLREVGALAICAGVMAGAVSALIYLMPAAWPHWLRLILEVTLGAVVYILALLISRPKPYIVARDFIWARYGAKLRRFIPAKLLKEGSL